MKKVLIFGAGNIGRGFLGQLFNQSGYEIVFVDIFDKIVTELNERKQYKLCIVSNNTSKEIIIDNVRAINANDSDTVINEINNTDLIATSVGVNALNKVAHLIADGIKKRVDTGNKNLLNIIICENLLSAGKILKQYLINYTGKNIYSDYIEKKVGFVETVVSRMIPPVPEEIRKIDPLIVYAEPYDILPVSKKGFKGIIPQIKGMIPYDNLNAYEEQKLFIHNLGHAITAYLGYLNGYTYIYESIGNKWINSIVRAALNESGKALNIKHNFSDQEQKQHINDLINRFANKSLGDTVYRVGREPIRKLGPQDRFIGAGKLCLKYKITPENISLGTAACLLYNYREDNQAIELQNIIKKHGIEKVLTEICQLDSKNDFYKLIYQKYNFLLTKFKTYLTQK
jgi:mannitol-1-phosphate 5-dehydrogenase